MSPHYRTIQEKFGSWNEAKQEADLDTVDPKHKRDCSFHTAKHGYEVISTKVNGVQKSVRLHRLVAVAEYGYDAVVDKSVHHESNIPWDNRPENLEPMTRAEHRSLHEANQNYNTTQ